MRIKVSGEITVERLAQALMEAAALHGAHFGAFFDANIYLQPYTKEGEPYTLVNKAGAELVHHLKLAPGAPAKPAQSVAVASKLAQRKDVRQQELAEHAAASEQAQRERDAWHAQVQAANRASMEQKIRLENEFQELLAAHGGALITAINDAIRAVWNEHQPLMVSGVNKGKPRPTPVFELNGDQVVLYADRTKSGPIKISTPRGLYKRRENQRVPFWTNDAWAIAAQKITVVLDLFAAKAAPSVGV